MLATGGFVLVAAITGAVFALVTNGAKLPFALPIGNRTQTPPTSSTEPTLPVSVSPSLSTTAVVKIAFVIDGEVTETLIINQGELLPEPDRPAKKGSTFEGWVDGSKNIWDFEHETASVDATLTASFKTAKKPKKELKKPNTVKKQTRKKTKPVVVIEED
jgi:hypothetical protein